MIRKKLFICLIASIVFTPIYSQKKPEIGFFGGTSYYLGDINSARQFYRSAPAFGGIMKLNLNPRYALKTGITYGQLSGRDRDFNNDYQQARNVSFSASLIEIAETGEFNFLPYKFDARKKVTSTYLFLGIAYTAFLQSSSNTGNQFTVPFGVGVKYALKKTINLGIEWGFRKTFTDGLDGVRNPGDSQYKSLINKNDWYSFAGFFITFGLFDNSGNCPVYQ